MQQDISAPPLASHEEQWDTLSSQFKIVEITTIKSDFNLSVDDLQPIDNHRIIFGITIDTKILQGNLMHRILKTVEILMYKEKARILVNLKFVISFEVNNKTEYLTLHTNTYTIETFANEFLDTVSISTGRGMLYSKLRGTYLDKIVLPLKANITKGS